MVSSMPYLKGDSPSLLETNVPAITQAYITTRSEWSIKQNARFGFHFSCRLDVIKLDMLLETNVPAITQANITIQFRMNHLKMLSMMWLLF